MINILDKNRAAYRQSLGKTAECPFCDGKNLKIASIKKLGSKHWHVLVNHFPYMDGNLMIIPKRHVKSPEELTKAEWQELQEVLTTVKNKLANKFKTDSFNLSLNLGPLSGASIEHLHWQIIPRTAKIQNATNIFGQIQVITVAPPDLKKLLDK